MYNTDRVPATDLNEPQTIEQQVHNLLENLRQAKAEETELLNQLEDVAQDLDELDETDNLKLLASLGEEQRSLQAELTAAQARLYALEDRYLYDEENQDAIPAAVRTKLREEYAQLMYEPDTNDNKESIREANEELALGHSAFLPKSIVNELMI